MKGGLGTDGHCVEKSVGEEQKSRRVVNCVREDGRPQAFHVAMTCGASPLSMALIVYSLTTVFIMPLGRNGGTCSTVNR